MRKCGYVEESRERMRWGLDYRDLGSWGGINIHRVSGSDEASISHSSQAKCKETGEKSSLRRRVLGCGGWSWYPIDSKGRALCFGRPGSELVVVE